MNKNIFKICQSLLLLSFIIITSTSCDRIFNREDSEKSSSNTNIIPGVDTTPPSVPQGFTVSNNDDSLIFSWQLNPESDLAGYELIYDNLSTPNSTLVKLGKVTTYEAHNLINNEQYSFILRAVDNSGNKGNPTNTIIETPTDTKGPDIPTVFNVNEVTNDTNSSPSFYVDLTWKNPSNKDFEAVIIVRKQNNAPSGPNDGTLIYEGTAETYRDSSISKGIVYHYKIFAKDEIPNYSTDSHLTQRSAIIPNQIITP